MCPMFIQFVFNNLKPVNTNNYQKITSVRGHPRKYKTKDTVQFEKCIDQVVDLINRRDLDLLNNHYDSAKHYLTMDYRFYLPVFTKKGLIAKRKNDIDGMIKPIQDMIFKHLKPDDSEIVSLTAMKIHSEIPRIEITINVKDISTIK